MYKNITLFVLTLLLFSSAQAAQLAKDGTTDWVIVSPDTPTAVEATACKELSTYLGKVTGATFPIVTETNATAPDTKRIYVGATSRCPVKNWKFDEILIQMSRGNLILAGHPQRGALYAVYSFLQDTVGVRWWCAGATDIPELATLDVSNRLYVSYAPQIRERMNNNPNAANRVFSPCMKGNGANPPEFGGRTDILWGVHTFYKMFPPKTHFAAHPEWYSLIDGKRQHINGQLCLTNQEVLDEALRIVKDTLKNAPEDSIVGFSQNDWLGACECEKCKAVYEKEGHSGTLINAVNYIADGIRDEYPHALVETLAYTYNREPPKTIKPRDNVLIRLCTDGAFFNRPLSDPMNKEFQNQINAWTRISKQIYIWDYATNYAVPETIHSNMHVLAPNIKFFAAHKAIAVFEESENDDFREMRDWIIYRLLWNPSLDANKLFTEFMEGYYGKSVAPFIKQYFSILEKRITTTKTQISSWGCAPTAYLDIVAMNELTTAMNGAVAACEKEFGASSPQMGRLIRSKTALDICWLLYYDEWKQQSEEQKQPFLGPQDFVTGCDELVDRATKTGAPKRIIDKTYGLRNTYLGKLNPPPFVKDLQDDEWIPIDALTFGNYGPVALVGKDKNSYSGLYLSMHNSCQQNVSFRPDKDHLGIYDVWVSVKCGFLLQPKEIPYKSVAVRLGALSANEGYKESFRCDLTVEELYGPEYKWFKVGRVNFKDTAVYVYFWHWQVKNLQISCDRAVLVKVKPEDVDMNALENPVLDGNARP